MPWKPPTALDSLRDTPADVSGLLSAYWAKRIAINSAAVLTLRATPAEVAAARGRADQAISQVRDETLNALASARREVAGLQRRALAGIEAGMARPAPADASEALLREQRKSKAWSRLQPILAREGASAALVGELAAELLASADGGDDGIDALREELPAFIRATAAADADARDRPALIQAALTGATAALDEAIGRARPDYRAALALRREIEQGVTRLGVGLGQAEYAVERGEWRATLPNWAAADGVRVVSAEPVAVGG
jgi:hypothetical protein